MSILNRGSYRVVSGTVHELKKIEDHGSRIYAYKFRFPESRK